MKVIPPSASRTLHRDWSFRLLFPLCPSPRPYLTRIPLHFTPIAPLPPIFMEANQLPVSRLTGKVVASTHFGGNGVYQDLTP
jgi:hypothetical protein